MTALSIAQAAETQLKQQRPGALALPQLTYYSPANIFIKAVKGAMEDSKPGPLEKIVGLGKPNIGILNGNNLYPLTGLTLKDEEVSRISSWLKDFHETGIYRFARLVIDFEDGLGRLINKKRKPAKHDYKKLAMDAGKAMAWYSNNLPEGLGSVYIRIPDLEWAPEVAQIVAESFFTEYSKNGGNCDLELGITVPKVRHPDHAVWTQMVLTEIEKKSEHLHLHAEIIIEASAGLYKSDGDLLPSVFHTALKDRLRHVAIGAYDYLFDMQVPGSVVSPTHSLMAHARHVLCGVFNGTTVSINNGPITRMVSPPKGDAPLDNTWLQNGHACIQFMKHVWEFGCPCKTARDLQRTR